MKPTERIKVYRKVIEKCSEKRNEFFICNELIGIKLPKGYSNSTHFWDHNTTENVINMYSELGLFQPNPDNFCWFSYDGKMIVNFKDVNQRRITALMFMIEIAKTAKK